MKELWGADKLEAELEAAKDDLRGLEKNIRKILGRDLPEGENGAVQNNIRVAQKRPLQEDRRRQNPDFPNNEFGPKRRWQGSNNTEPKTVFSRLSARVPSTADDSADEDDTGFKPAVSSRVIATPREIPSRQDVIRRESTDERSRQRNKRMFGALLGTLQKFRQEETKLKAKEDKKAEVEARVEEAKRREREELKRERQQLFLNRKQQLAQVKALEAKLARSRQFQDWRSAQIPLLNFIKTKTQPSIYYLPKRSTPETDSLLQESSNALKAEIDRREKALVEELEAIQAQVGAVKNQHDRNTSLLENQDQSMNEEPEEEENRDPNPNKNGDIEMNENNPDQSFNHEENMKNKEMDSDKEEENNVSMQDERDDREERIERGERGERGQRDKRGEREERGERGKRGEEDEPGEKDERGVRDERGERGEREEHEEREERKDQKEEEPMEQEDREGQEDQDEQEVKDDKTDKSDESNDD